MDVVLADTEPLHTRAMAVAWARYQVTMTSDEYALTVGCDYGEL
jgi:hypothetical protein